MRSSYIEYRSSNLFHGLNVRLKVLCATKVTRNALTACNSMHGCRDTRESLGLRLAGNVVIVDEAHNLVSAINSSHSVTITTEQLTSTSGLLLSYMNTFQKLLGMPKAATVTAIKGTADRMAAKASEILQVSPDFVCFVQLRCTDVPMAVMLKATQSSYFTSSCDAMLLCRVFQGLR